MITHRVAGTEQPGYCLGGIQRTAAADANDYINGVSRVGRDKAVDEIRAGFAGDVNLFPSDLFLRKGLAQGRPGSTTIEGFGTRYKECRASKTGRKVGDSNKCAGAKNNAGQAADLEGGKHCVSNHRVAKDDTVRGGVGRAAALKRIGDRC